MPQKCYLAEADRHIAVATARIARLRVDIANMEPDDSEASAARDVLEVLEVTLGVMRRSRTTIEQLLETLRQDDAEAGQGSSAHRKAT